MEQTDIVIIGAGVIGLAIASELSEENKRVVVLEKEKAFGQHTSSRNSEVIHAGIYYKQDSLKAKLCVAGRVLLYALCEKNKIPYKKTGKLIIACKETEKKILYQLQQNARRNGVELEALSNQDIETIEPNIKAKTGLFSKETGIVDSHELMRYLYNNTLSNNGDIIFNTEVRGLENNKRDYILDIDDQKEKVFLKAQTVINCAGNNAGQISAMLGISVEQEYLKGNYFRVSDQYRGMTKHLVYPVPAEKSLGLHTVLSLDGGLKIGPDEQEIDVFDYQVDDKRKSLFFNEASKYLPFLKEEDLSPDIAGIRPRLIQRDRDGFSDFIIRDEKDNGFPGFINLAGIDSPGLTASLAIAKHVKELVR